MLALHAGDVHPGVPRLPRSTIKGKTHAIGHMDYKFSAFYTAKTNSTQTDYTMPNVQGLSSAATKAWREVLSHPWICSPCSKTVEKNKHPAVIKRQSVCASNLSEPLQNTGDSISYFFRTYPMATPLGPPWVPITPPTGCRGQSPRPNLSRVSRKKVSPRALSRE